MVMKNDKTKSLMKQRPPPRSSVAPGSLLPRSPSPARRGNTIPPSTVTRNSNGNVQTRAAGLHWEPALPPPSPSAYSGGGSVPAPITPHVQFSGANPAPALRKPLPVQNQREVNPFGKRSSVRPHPCTALTPDGSDVCRLPARQTERLES